MLKGSDMKDCGDSVTEKDKHFLLRLLNKQTRGDEHENVDSYIAETFELVCLSKKSITINLHFISLYFWCDDLKPQLRDTFVDRIDTILDVIECCVFAHSKTESAINLQRQPLFADMDLPDFKTAKCCTGCPDNPCVFSDSHDIQSAISSASIDGRSDWTMLQHKVSSPGLTHCPFCHSDIDASFTKPRPLCLTVDSTQLWLNREAPSLNQWGLSIVSSIASLSSHAASLDALS